MNKKIIFFIGSMNWGGAERVISILSQKYSEKGWDVTIVTLLSNKCIYDLNEKIDFISLARENKRRINNVFYWINNIIRILKSLKPSVVVSFVCRINILVLISKLFSKIKCRVVVSERNDPRFDGRGKIAIFLCKILYKKADLLICQTQKEKCFFPKKIQEKSVVIMNPVMLITEPVEFNQKEKVVINVGRYEKSKNQKMLIDIFREIYIEGKTDGFILKLYGSGSLENELNQYVSQIKMDEFIKIEKSTLFVQKEISKASIFCLCSNYEGMSNALMEALLLGTPAISTNVSGADDLICDGTNGFIIPLNNKDLFKEKLIKLIQSRELRKKMHLNLIDEKFRIPFENSIFEYEECIEGRQN